MVNPFSVRSILGSSMRIPTIKRKLSGNKKWCECWDCRRRFRKGLRRCPHCGVTQ